MKILTRRDLIAGSAAGFLAAPLTSLAAVDPAGTSVAGEGCQSGWGTKDSKYSWTVVAPPGTDRKEFQQFVLRDLAKAAAKSIPRVTKVAVLLQEVDAFSSGLVRIGDKDYPVDAVIEITTSQPYAPVKEANAHLAASCGYVQGWNVHPTLIFDFSAPVPLGARSERPRILVYLQRLDGTTPDHFNVNWYKHAGHADGKEAESSQSRAYQESHHAGGGAAVRPPASSEEEAQIRRALGGSGQRYMQNRILEPLTPTQWVMNGYTDLSSLQLAPRGDSPRYERHNGEDIFEEWPPRMVQGYQYTLVA